MIKNYLKTAIRRLIHNRSISLINILGLSLGMAATFAILLFIFHELNYDKHIPDRDRIYRVVQEVTSHSMKTAQGPFPLGGVLKEEYPQIEEVARMVSLSGVLVQKDKQWIPEENFLTTENAFFHMFSVPILYGEREDLTNDPYDVVLTESTAMKYFGKIDVVGKEVSIKSMGEEYSLTVSGVIKDFPSNSSLKADFLSSVELGVRQLPKMVKTTDKSDKSVEFFKNEWSFGFFTTYLLSQPGFNPENFEDELRKVEEKYLEDPSYFDYHLQGLREVYFHSSGIIGGIAGKGQMSNVYVFGIIGFLILLVASINYVLLSTSQSLERSREIGIRKITGATRKRLSRQVFTESLVMTLLAFPLSIILIEQTRPFMIHFMDKEFIHYEWSFQIILVFALVLFVITYIPGMFTIRYFSRIEPVNALKGIKLPGTHQQKARKLLVSVQFIIFIVLVSLSVGIYKQLYYTKHHDLGFDPENVITFNIGMNPSLASGYESFKQKLLTHHDITEVSAGMWIPPTNSRMSITLKSEKESGQKIKAEALYIDKDFVETMGLNLLKGKTLSDFGNHYEKKILLNEAAVEELSLDEPIGETFWMGEVVGVVEDFHFHTFHEEIGPMFLVGGSHMVKEVLVRTSAKDAKEVKKFLHKSWETFAGGEKLSLSFLKDRFDQLYKKERKLAVLTAFFAGLAIFIASMGLLGLTIFTLKKRTKEIAIRKVNGASVRHILQMISYEYVRLLFVSIMVATPVSYYFLTQWLENFAYKTTLSWWIFGLAGLVSFVIVFATIGFKTLEAANSNPVESLKTE